MNSHHFEALKQIVDHDMTFSIWNKSTIIILLTALANTLCSHEPKTGKNSSSKQIDNGNQANKIANQ